MAQRTNLISKNNPLKYIIRSVFLLLLSGLGIMWLMNNEKKKIVPVETETEEIVKNDEEEVREREDSQVIITPVISETATASPTIKKIEYFENLEEGFAVKYENKRNLVIENEESGKRYVFSNYLGNITVHVGEKWSWISSERVFSDNFMVDGEKSYIYEISNQKIVDVEKGGRKYTIQCVHNGKEELKIECQKFLEEFRFI